MKTRSVYRELMAFGRDGHQRGADALSIVYRAFGMIENEFPPEHADLIIKAWLRAAKDRDPSKFERVYKKYRNTDQKPASGLETEQDQ